MADNGFLDFCAVLNIAENAELFFNASLVYNHELLDECNARLTQAISLDHNMRV